MRRLVNVVKPYAWGSKTAIAELLGNPSPSAGPEAELWMGAHPSSPSRLLTEEGETPLDRVITENPRGELGEASLSAFGPKLPFLLKVLAAGAPLSLQAHPSAEQARLGFARENAAGIALDAPTRSYKDDNHKPEVICALTPFWALSGFRSAAEIARIFRALAVPGLSPFVARLESEEDEASRLREVFLGLFGHESKAALSAEVSSENALSALNDAGFADEATWTARLAREYPGDIGVVVALLLNLVKLSPGHALFLDAGNLHAYLDGTGVELMASSDNVLRGGLTVKHVDVPGLSEVLDFRPGGVPRAARVATKEGAIAYRTSAREFALSRIELSGRRTFLPSEGPEILLVVRGSAEITRGEGSIDVGGGESVYLAHSTAKLVLSGEATVFRATTALSKTSGA
jgi:mannose-6-phosphate isomerase